MMYGRRVDINELRRRAANNLQDLASGALRRRNEATAQENKARAEAAKEERRLKRIEIRNAKASLKAKARERDDLHKYYLELEGDPNPLGYSEGMTEAQNQGLLEEVDSRIEVLTHEIGDLQDEIYYATKTLRSMGR